MNIMDRSLRSRPPALGPNEMEILESARDWNRKVEDCLRRGRQARSKAFHETFRSLFRLLRRSLEAGAKASEAVRVWMFTPFYRGPRA